MATMIDNESKDPRAWSFQKRVLSENTLQTIKKKHKRRYADYWVVAQLSSGEYKHFQLSKDIQAAIHMNYEHAKESLIGSLLVVPTGRYDEDQGRQSVDVAQVAFLYRHRHSSDSRWISRGQFVKPVYHWEKRHLFSRNTQMIKYLQHDYDELSQARIAKHVRELMKPALTLTWLVWVAILLIFVLGGKLGFLLGY